MTHKNIGNRNFKTMTHNNQTHEKLVATGELATGSEKGVIKTTTLGSCVAVIAYDKKSKIGGVAHIMLPGRSPNEEKSDENKYAENAIENLLIALNSMGAAIANIAVCIAGGANVLKKADDSICVNNIKSVKKTIKNEDMHLSAESVGGTKRRTIRLDVEQGNLYISIGEADEMLLWKY